MRIATEIMEKVEQKEEDIKNFHRCIDVLICPKCGKPLEKMEVDDPNFKDLKYTCSNRVCNFEHTKLGK